VNSLRLGGRAIRDPRDYATQGGEATGISTSADQVTSGMTKLLGLLGLEGAGEDEVDDPEEYPPDQWYIDNLPYPWNVAPKSKKRGADLTRIVTQAKVEPFSGGQDCYFQWRNKVLGYLHKSPGAITAKMLALTALLDIQDPVLKKMIPDETFSARSYATLLHNLERVYGGNDRLMNHMMQQIKNFPVIEYNDSVELDEFVTLVQRYVEVQGQIREPTDGRQFFQDVYLRLPPIYQHKFGEWLAAKNVQGLLLGAPVQKANLLLLLDWADQYLQVLRTTQEITDYTSANLREKPKVHSDDKESDSGDDIQETASHQYNAVAIGDVREGDEDSKEDTDGTVVISFPSIRGGAKPTEEMIKQWLGLSAALAGIRISHKRHSREEAEMSTYEDGLQGTEAITELPVKEEIRMLQKPSQNRASVEQELEPMLDDEDDPFRKADSHGRKVVTRAKRGVRQPRKQ